MALECHLLTTLDTPEHVREIFDAVDSPFACANYDPVNFVSSLDAVYDSGAVAEHVAATIGPRLAPSCHIKDLSSSPISCSRSPSARRDGIMDLDGVIESCRHLPEDSSLIVEHFGPEESATALRYVAGLAERHGLLGV